MCKKVVHTVVQSVHILGFIVVKICSQCGKQFSRSESNQTLGHCSSWSKVICVVMGLLERTTSSDMKGLIIMYVQFVAGNFIW